MKLDRPCSPTHFECRSPLAEICSSEKLPAERRHRQGAWTCRPGRGVSSVQDEPHNLKRPTGLDCSRSMVLQFSWNKANSCKLGSGDVGYSITRVTIGLQCPKGPLRHRGGLSLEGVPFCDQFVGALDLRLWKCELKLSHILYRFVSATAAAANLVEFLPRRFAPVARAWSAPGRVLTC